MYRHLFRNRWVALAFVLLMTASAAMLVGTEDSGGVIDQATAELQGQKAQFEQQTEELARPTRSHRVLDISEVEGEEPGDADLIDPATGTEPMPDPGEGFEPEPDLDPTPVTES